MKLKKIYRKLAAAAMSTIFALNMIFSVPFVSLAAAGFDGWSNISGARYGTDAEIGEYMVADGSTAASAPKSAAFDYGSFVCVEFDMMIPGKKADGTSDNLIEGGNTGGIALMEGDTVAGVIGYRGNGKGEPDNILSQGGTSSDYVNALGGTKATAYFDRWMHYIVIADTAAKKGDLYMIDYQNGTVYSHEGRFDKYISNISKLTHIGIVSNQGYSIAVANLKVSEPKVSQLSISAEDNMTTQYLPGEGSVSTVQYHADAEYLLAYNKNGAVVPTETSVVLSNAAIDYSIEDVGEQEIHPEGMSISENGLLSIEHSAEPGTYFIKASSGGVSQRIALELKGYAFAGEVQIAGKNEILVGENRSLKAISIADTGTVLPEKEMTWEFVGDPLGCTVENGVIIAGNQSGKVTVKATSVENGVSGTIDIYIRTQKQIDDAKINMEGIILSSGTTEFGEKNAVHALAVRVKEEIPSAKAIVSVFNKDDVCLVNNTFELQALKQGVYSVKTPTEMKKASYIRAYIVSNNEVLTTAQADITNGIYKGIPMVADWVTGEKSGMGMGAGVLTPQGAPAGVDPALVNTYTSRATYAEDHYDEVIKENVTTNNLLWYKTGAWSNKNTATIYAQHGEDWEQQALPVGNGYMGAMLFGMPAKDHIQFNEETFWAAGYRGIQNNVGPTYTNPQMSEGINGYMNAGNIFVDFGLPEGTKVTNYYRDLNLDEAVAHVKYEYDSVKYSREYFASYPGEVIVMRYTADQAGKLNFTVNPVSAHPGDISVNNGEITVTGKLKDSEPYSSGGNASWNQESDLEYCTKLKVILNSSDGAIADEYGKVRVENASDVYIVVAASTDYDPSRFVLDENGNADPTVVQYKNERGLEYAIEKAAGRLHRALELSYDELKSAHVKDYKAQFDTVGFKLTDTVSTTPTNELQASFKNVVGTKENADGTTSVSYDGTAYKSLDRHLEELHYNYARYLMISSSRSTTMPATLQGKWCQSVSEIWGSCYCININMEMNYWFTGGANLIDSARALVKWFNAQAPAGKITAKNYYNVTPKGYQLDGNRITFTDSADEKDEVFIMHTKQAIMGTTDLTGGTSIQSPGNTAWLMYNLWDLYQTTGDKQLLENDIYPIMRKVANFYTQYMYKNLKKTTTDVEKYPDGYYYTTWSGRSPEQGPTHEGIKYDLQLVAGMYDYTIAAAEALDADPDKVGAWKEIRNHLEVPVELGEDGQIKEWDEETTYNTDANGKALGDPTHRHISHLVGLYPGTLISRDTPEFLEGAKTVLTKRGDDSTGWSCSNKFLLWARTLEGDKALELFRFQLAQKTYANLFDTHAPFQIDGNFGSAAGVMELLMQSQTGTVYLLPALPQAWVKGEINGIKTKDGAKVDISWSENRLENATITPIRNGAIKLGYNVEDVNLKVTDTSGKEQILAGKEGIYILNNAVAGMEYTITTTNEAVKEDYQIKSINETEHGYTVVVTKNKNTASDDVLILASYDEKGTMLGVDTVSFAGSSDGDNSFEINILKGAQVKAFIWNGLDTMNPLYAPYIK